MKQSLRKKHWADPSSEVSSDVAPGGGPSSPRPVRAERPSLRRLALLAGCGLSLAFPALAQIPRTDTAVCRLPGGHRIELSSRYLWMPINPHPRSDRTHHEQRPYSVLLVPAQGRKQRLTEDSDAQALDADVADRKCASYGAGDGLVFSFHDLVVLPSGERPPTLALYEMGIASSASDRSALHRKLLEEEGLAFPAGWAYGLSPQGQLTAEQGLYSAGQREQIAAVLRFTSDDKGKTWHQQGLFRESRLFELGKPWEAQPFIGRAVKVNGQRVRP